MLVPGFQTVHCMPALPLVDSSLNCLWVGMYVCQVNYVYVLTAGIQYKLVIAYEVQHMFSVHTTGLQVGIAGI